MNPRHVLVLSVLSLASLAGCPSKETASKDTPSSKTEDPYAKDIARICNATETTPKGVDDPDPPTRANEMATWIAANLETAKGKQFFSDLSGKNPLPSDKGKALRAESTATGGKACPLADWYDIPHAPKVADPNAP